MLNIIFLFILHVTVTLINFRIARPVTQKITGRCGVVTPTGTTRYALSVTVTSGFFMLNAKPKCTFFIYLKQTPENGNNRNKRGGRKFYSFIRSRRPCRIFTAIAGAGCGTFPQPAQRRSAAGTSKPFNGNAAN